MIRINLLKKAVRRNQAAGKKPSLFSRPVMLASAALLILVVAGGGYFWARTLQQQQVVEVPKQSTGYVPSTHTRPNMIEEVVKEEPNERVRTLNTGFLDIPYAEMSFAEKINYEVLFARQVTSMLARAVPVGINFKALEIDNFVTVYAVGLGPSRDQVSAMFSTLRTERVELLSPPYSYIKSNKGQGFRFVFTCKAKYGLDLADPFQVLDHLSSRDNLPILLKNISRIAQSSSVRFVGEPELTGGEKTGSYRRMQYHLRATSSYKDFVKFVVNLYNDRIPCAFKKISLTAESGTAVKIDADVIITARD